MKTLYSSIQVIVVLAALTSIACGERQGAFKGRQLTASEIAEMRAKGLMPGPKADWNQVGQAQGQQAQEQSRQREVQRRERIEAEEQKKQAEELAKMAAEKQAANQGQPQAQAQAQARIEGSDSSTQSNESTERSSDQWMADKIAEISRSIVIDDKELASILKGMRVVRKLRGVRDGITYFDIGVDLVLKVKAGKGMGYVAAPADGLASEADKEGTQVLRSTDVFAEGKIRKLSTKLTIDGVQAPASEAEKVEIYTACNDGNCEQVTVLLAFVIKNLKNEERLAGAMASFKAVAGKEEMQLVSNSLLCSLASFEEAQAGKTAGREDCKDEAQSQSEKSQSQSDNAQSESNDVQTTQGAQSQSGSQQAQATQDSQAQDSQAEVSEDETERSSVTAFRDGAAQNDAEAAARDELVKQAAGEAVKADEEKQRAQEQQAQEQQDSQNEVAKSNGELTREQQIERNNAIVKAFVKEKLAEEQRLKEANQ